MAKQENKATPLTEEQLNQKEAELKSKSENLAKEKEDFQAEKDAFQAEKDAFELEKEALNSTSLEGSVKTESIKEFEYNGEKYAFSETAPEIIRYGGQKFTKEEISNNEDLLLELIGGNSSLIKKIN